MGVSILVNSMMSLFKTYVGIDYCGAKTPTSRLKGLRVFKATLNSEPMKVKFPAGKKWNWTRKEIAHWCFEQLKDKDPVIIGIDHGFSNPMSYMERYRRHRDAYKNIIFYSSTSSNCPDLAIFSPRFSAILTAG